MLNICGPCADGGVRPAFMETGVSRWVIVSRRWGGPVVHFCEREYVWERVWLGSASSVLG